MSEIVRALALSKLTVLLKPNGRVRGIAAGDAFRRLVTRGVARQKQDVLRNLVAPVNFGLCHRAGTDALVHLVQFLLEEPAGDSQRVLLSVDGVGAFDHVNRARFFEQLRDNASLHDLMPFVKQWYNGPTRLSWQDGTGTVHEILQGDGGEQGDALMPGLFCLALRSALDEIQQALPAGATILAYLDDIYVICAHGDTHACYEVVRSTLLRSCNININMGKLAAWGIGRNDSPPGLVELGENVWKGNLAETDQGIKVLGTPVGTEAYIAEFGRAVVRDEAQLLELIPKLASLQAAWLLLYFCAVPRVNHLLRTLRPASVTEAARQHDAGVMQIFRGLFDIPSETGWDQGLHSTSYAACIAQAVLPQRLGGCGLRNSLRTSHAACWASWADSLSTILERFPDIWQSDARRHGGGSWPC